MKWKSYAGVCLLVLSAAFVLARLRSNPVVAPSVRGAATGAPSTALDLVARLFAAANSKAPEARVASSPAVDYSDVLTEEQLAKIKPSLNALARTEEVAVNDGDDELLGRVAEERQRLFAAVTGLEAGSDGRRLSVEANR